MHHVSNKMSWRHLCVSVLSIFSPVKKESGCSFFPSPSSTDCEPGLLCGDGCVKIHVHMLSSEAEHSEAEPQALLSMSGHMVGVLAW